MQPIKFEPVTNWEEAFDLLASVEKKFSALPVVKINNSLERSDVAIELREIATLTKKLEAISKQLKEPARKYIAEVDSLIKPVLAVLERSEQPYKQVILAWDKLERERLQAEENAKAEKLKQEQLAKAFELEEKGHDIAVKVLEAQIDKIEAKEVKNVNSEQAAGVTGRKIKKWRVVDIKAVPHEFLEPISSKINQAMRVGVPVAGIEYYEEETLSARGL